MSPTTKEACTFPSTSELAARLNAKSREGFYDVYESFDWPEELAADYLAVPLEYTTLYGTEVWSDLNDEQKRKLTITDTANLYANTLNGERLLVSGLSSQLYGKAAPAEITDYLHHFLDEENKHMIMFGVFCRKYIGRVYPEKKFSFEERKYAPGEELLRFYAQAMVVEAYGDFYNVRAMNDDQCDPLVRDISRVHHVDEARHLAFDRAYITELAAQHLPGWDDDTLKDFRTWLAEYMRVNWLTFYNPAAYKDAGIEAPYEAAKIAMASEYQTDLREKISAGVVKFFMKCGLLDAQPAL